MFCTNPYCLLISQSKTKITPVNDRVTDSKRIKHNQILHLNILYFTDKGL